MTKAHRNFLSFLIVMLVLALVAVATSGGRTSVSLRSVLETWMDVVRDVDRFGLRLTRVPTAEEEALGDHFLMAIRPSLLSAPEQSRYVSDIGKALVANARRKDINYRFHIVEWPVANAFALPGGHVVVTRKLLDLAKSEAELAAILGHEIAHIDLRHCIERYQYELKLRRILPKEIATLGRVAHELVVLGYSEVQEREADKYGMLLTALARYHPKHALAVYDRFSAMAPGSRAPPERRRFVLQELGDSVIGLLKDYFATHPPWEDRIREGIATLSRNDSAWKHQSFYVGRGNHQKQLSRSASPSNEEWKPFSDQPFAGEYFSSKSLTDYKAMATNLASGMAAIVFGEASPEAAISKAIATCEVHASPCRITALGNIAMGEDISAADKIDEYLTTVCANQESAKQAHACTLVIERGLAGAQQLGDAHLVRAASRIAQSPDWESLGDLKLAVKLGALRTDLRRSLVMKICNASLTELKIEGCTMMVEDEGASPKDRAKAYVNRGVAFREREKLYHAIVDFGLAIQLTPKWKTAYLERAKTRERNKSYHLAQSDYAKVVELDALDRDALLKKVEMEWQTKQCEQGVKDATRYIDIYPYSATIFNLRGLCLLYLRKLNDALSDFKEALSLNPRYGAALNNRCLVFAELGDFSSALADCAAAIRVSSRTLPARINRAKIYLMMGDPERALSEADLLLQYKPGLATGFVLRGFAYCLKNELDSASTDLKLAQATKSDLSIAFMLEACITYRKSEFEKSLNAIERALEAQPLSRSPALLQRGEILEALGRRDEAISVYQEILSYAPAFERAAKALQQLQLKKDQ